MQYTLKTLLLVFVLVAAALGLIGPWGLLPVLYYACVIIGYRVASHRLPSGGNPKILLLLLALPIMVFIWPAGHAPRWATQEHMCGEQLRQIGKALREYHKDHGSFPPVCVRDEEGKPMHGWRVLLLPYLEEGDLYKNYRLDEPWDSLNNSMVAATAPSCFHCPCGPAPNTRTTDYVAVTGPGTVWPDEGTVTKEDIKDGSNRTLMVVEIADSTIPWNAPVDLTLDEIMADPEGSKALMSYHSGQKSQPVARGYYLMASGATWWVAGRFMPESLEAMSTIAGGEDVDEIKALPAPSNRIPHTQWSCVTGFLVLVITFVYLVTRPLPEAWTRRKDGTESTQPEDR
ncbi:MAG: DUF1559 domain-containing protein [Pirellulales bacterium]|nr:DUF1559 domain-containing protein [Pirellulales bacterium]